MQGQIIILGAINLARREKNTMATVINTPGTRDRDLDDTRTDAGAGMGMILGIIVAVILGALFFIYGLPYLRSGFETQGQDGVNLNVNVPAPGGADTTPAPAPTPQ